MVMSALVLVTGIGAPALAAGNDMTVAISPVDQTVPAGSTISYEVNWQCGSVGASSCDNAKLEVEIPASSPDGILLEIGSYTAVTVDGVSYPVRVEGTGADRKIVWDFPASFSPGKYQTVTFTLNTQNWVTPDGTTITPKATFTSSLGSATQEAPPATITADIGVHIVKTKSQPAEDRPYLDGEVTYKLEPGYPQQWTSPKSKTPFINFCNANQAGMAAMTDMQIVDQLPAGAVFVRATGDHTYDPQSHTVTWQLGDSHLPDDDGGAPFCNYYFADPVFVTVVYPTAVFEDVANTDQKVRNTATVTGKPWLRNTVISDDTAAEHPLQAGGEGKFTVQKANTYSSSNERGAEFNRGGHAAYSSAGKGFLYSFSVEDEARLAAGVWNLVDMMPCGFTSPTDTTATGCDAPAFTDISFGAVRSVAELKVHWTTNQGRAGICTIPGSDDQADTTTRFCEGVAPKTGISMADGEWITKFEVKDNPLNIGTSGSLLVFGAVNRDLPLDNSAAVANGEYQPHFYDQNTQLPAPGVTPASQHPLWVTVENCTAENTVTWRGGSMSQNDRLVDPDHPGRCGFVRVTRDPIEISTEKRVYNPALSTTVDEQTRQASAQPGDALRVEMLTSRGRWDGATDAQIAAKRFTPTLTEILPENLEFAPADSANPLYYSLESPWAGYSEWSRPASAVEAKLGKPRLTVSEVIIDGKTRTKLVVDFPNMPTGGGLLISDPEFSGIGDILNVGFDVRVKAATPPATYRNYTLTQAAEAATEYLKCESPGVMVDPKVTDATTNWAPLDRETNGVEGPEADSGCRANKPYTVVLAPGLSAAKQVKGVRDEAFVGSPGIGSTDSTGDALYQIPLQNSGNVELRDVAVYDVLPRVGDTGVRPGADQRGSEFNVFLTGPVTGLPSGAQAEYSKSTNPCRGELAGDGTGSHTSAPAGCSDDWTSAEPADWSTVTALRVTFGTRVWQPGESHTISFPARAGGGDGADLTKVAWNNVALAAKRAADGRPMLPTEAPKVGLQLTPDLSWRKVDGLDTDRLLAGSEWTLTPVVADGEEMPPGEWPLTIADCESAGACTGRDTDAASGKFTLSGIPWGEYELRETKAPAGFVALDAPVRVNISEGKLNRATWTYEIGTIANFKPGVDLSWKKTDEEGVLLAGSSWNLVPVDAAGQPLPGGTVISLSDCVADSASECAGHDRDPAAGQFTLTNVPAGTYHLVETQAPAGFVKLDTPIKVTVAGDTEVKLGDIVNRQVEVPALPLTGGIGSFLFMLGGGAFLVLMCVFAARSVRARRLI